MAIDPKSTASEAIKAATDELVEALKAGKSEVLTAYLAAIGRFHNDSFGNRRSIREPGVGIASQSICSTPLSRFYKVSKSPSLSGGHGQFASDLFLFFGAPGIGHKMHRP
jgi:hypothetical protein